MAQDKSAEVIEFSVARSGAGGETAGEFLAKTREAAGIGLYAVSDAIKVKPNHLSAIEAMRAEALPSIPYAVGFVKSYASYLGLDAEGVAAQFKREIAQPVAGATVTPLETVAVEARVDTGEGARVASIFAILAIIVFGVWVLTQIGKDRELTPATAAGEPARIVVRAEPIETPRPAPIKSEPAEKTAQEAPAQAATEASLEPLAAAPSPAHTSESAPQISAAAPPTVEAVAPQKSEALSASAPVQEPRTSALSTEAAEESAVDISIATRPAAPSSALAPVAEVQISAEPTPVIAGATLIRAAEPVYPDNCAAAATDLESVTILFDVTPAGRTANARVTSTTNACFNDAALNALGRWRFSPKTVDGAPAVDAAKRATINFRG